MDTAGKKAISHDVLVYCYKAGLFRCGDNLNILGPTAMCWHPDRNQFFNAAKDFRNGSDYCLRGWDTASSTWACPRPQAQLWDMIDLKEARGWYPDPTARGDRRTSDGRGRQQLQHADRHHAHDQTLGGL